MVHVEIFYGGDTGEATIGARFAKGVVQVWPSYKFDSNLWELHAYHFCSIETWLDGECKSHCPEHEWKCSAAALARAAGERSIFNDGSDDNDVESDDESAGGGTMSDQENDEGNMNQSNLDDCKPILKSAKSATKSKPKSKKSKGPRKTVNVSETTEKKDEKNKVNYVNSYYVCKSNGWKLVVAALDKRGWHQLPFDYSFSTRYSLKWVERRSQIDYKAHHDGQLVNHIINNDVLTTKNGLLCCLREFYCNECNIEPSYTENEGEVASVLTKLMHGQPIDPSFACPRAPTPWLPESYQLDSVTDCVALLLKDSQASKLQSDNSILDEKVGSRVEAVQNIPDPPCTPHLSPRNGKTPTHLWIYKPSASNRGRGVKMVQGGKDLIEVIKEYHPILYTNGIEPGIVKKFERPKIDYADESMIPKPKEATFALPPPKALIQHYLMDPLLSDGCKFDIRCYMLITRTSPTYKAYYHPGYCRCVCHMSMPMLTIICVLMFYVSISRCELLDVRYALFPLKLMI